jgi:hypothetical protein
MLLSFYVFTNVPVDMVFGKILVGRQLPKKFDILRKLYILVHWSP